MKKLLCILLLSNTAAAQHEHHHQESPTPQTQEADDGPRDPHANSGGYTQHSNPYVVQGMSEHSHGGDDSYLALLMERFEIVGTKDEKPLGQFEGELWYGTSFEKWLLRSEGEVFDHKVSESENELLWAHAIAPYWDTVAGLRYDAGNSVGQGYLALGVRGLAPYWFETNANLYIADEGRTAFKAEAQYELLFSQRLILSPRLELDLADLLKTDERLGRHSEKATFGLRLRYEIYRRFAPYIGLETSQYFGVKETSEPQPAVRNSAVAGVKFWL
ncbi:MAG: copper resistance protein B [Proteobacteria bacterium]|nr:MAG: copper resistance protein B [Pseudomonadota bacterium]